MTYVILIAHGSRETLANQEVHDLVRSLADKDQGRHYLAAFLDPVAQPSIPDTIDTAISAGATRILVVPYFLNSGKHVQQDIPDIIAAKQSGHPDVEIRLTEHIGAHPALIELLQSMIGKE